MGFETMFYDENHLGKKAEKTGQKIIQEVKNYLKTSELNYKILGLNPKEAILLQEQLKSGKDKKEIKVIDKTIAFLKDRGEEGVMVILKFNDIYRQITVTFDSYLAEGLPAEYNCWTAVLEFPLPQALIFGRAYKKSVFYKGDFFFAPLNAQVFDHITSRIKSIPDLSLINEEFLKIAASDSFIKSLNDIRFGSNAFNQMKEMYQLIKDKKQSGNPIVDALNQDKNFVKILKEVLTYGRSRVFYGIVQVLHFSEVDVSTIVIPLSVVTLVQIVNFEVNHNKVLKALFELAKTLQRFTIKS